MLVTHVWLPAVATAADCPSRGRTAHGPAKPGALPGAAGA